MADIPELYQDRDKTFRVGGGDTGVPPGEPPSSNKTPFVSDDELSPEMKALLKQIEEAYPKPKELTESQKIGSAFIRMGAAFGGRDANITSPAEDRYASEVRAYEGSRAEVTRLRLTDAIKRRDAEAASKQKLLEDQSREQFKAQLKDKEDAINEYSALLKEPEFAKFVPAGFDISKASYQDVLGIKRVYYESQAQAGGMGGQIGTVIAAMDSLKKLAPGLMRDQTPTTTVSSTGEGKGNVSVSFGEPESAGAHKQVVTKSGLSPAKLADISFKLGKNVTHMSLDEINQASADFMNERKNWVKLSAAEAEEFANLDMVISESEEMLEAVQKTGIGGADTFGFATSQEASDFRAKALNIRDIMERSRTGATTNPRDTSTYDILAANFGNFTRNNIAALKNSISFFSGLIDKRMNYRMIPESQRRHIRFQRVGLNPDDADLPDVPDGMIEAP